jgi:ribonucleoside-triphosphate reductase
MKDRRELEGRLADLKAELGRVEGTETEVYSRIVGYYRSVRNWNAGKREEYRERVSFALPSAAQTSIHQAALAAQPIGTSPSAAVKTHNGAAVRSGVLVFTRANCPNCPPVAAYISSVGLPAVFVDVDEEAGLALARRHGVMATPTVVGLDGEGRESFRAHGIAELKARLPAVNLGAC